MARPQFARSTSAAFGLAGVSLVTAALGIARPGGAGAADDHFAEAVRPILERRCFGCHGAEEQEAGFRVDVLDPDMVAGDDAEAWDYARELVEFGDMPPGRAQPLTDDERRALLGWLDESLEAAARANETAVPRTVFRRLNRAQYANTLRSLLGVDVDYSAELPPDARSEAGFRNNGEALGASLLHLEAYERVARAAMDEAMPLGPRPEARRYRVRFGEGIGAGEVAARTGGYQSVPLDTNDFVIDVLGADGEPREPANEEERAAIDALKRKISVGFRGSSRDRFRVGPDGLTLYGAVPHREVAPGAWQGPSPNMKLELQRVFPEEGRLAVRVRASRGSVWRTRDTVLVPLEGGAPRVSLDEAGAASLPEGAVAFEASSSDQRENVREDAGALVPEDATKDSKARVAGRIPTEGFWQIDVVHPPVPIDRMPSIRFAHANQTLDVRPRIEGAALELPRAATTVGAAYLKAGRREFTVGGPFFTGFERVVLTPLPDDHPLVLDLDERAAALEARSADDVPVLRFFAGTRTDDGMDYGEFGEALPVEAAPGAPRTYEVVTRLENVPVPAPESGDNEILSGILVIGLWNDHLVLDRRSPGPPLLVESIEIEAPYHPVWPPRAQTEILLDRTPFGDDEEAWARAALERFLGRAFRRPADAETVDAYMGFWRAARADLGGAEEAIKETCVAALCSPRFLYLAEPADPESPAELEVDDYALASRLSYFLWDGPPDERLLALAAEGELRERRGEEALRLLDDPRSRRFVEAFGEAWLRLDRLAQTSTDARRYPHVTRFVERDMRLESLAFLEHHLRTGAPLDDLVAADHALLNRHLAEYYGVPGVHGPEFRVVELPDGRARGGLLTMGAFLVGHSDGVHPHPIKRAVWVRERLLGNPPPPPPPNVPDLDPDAPGFQDLTLKEQLERHRDSASCRDCHAGIDPWGVALEALGADGRPAEVRNGRPVDARATLPSGAQVLGVSGLQAHLLAAERDAIAESLAAHLLGYALGRDLMYADEPAIADIVEDARPDGLGLRAVVESVVTSPAFVR